MVGLNIVIAAILAFSAALCIGASLGMRGNVPLAWLGAALIAGSVQTLVMTLFSSNHVEIAVAGLLAPFAYICAGQAIRAMSPHASQGPIVVSVVALLVGLAILLLALDAPFFYQALAIQSACTIAVTDATIQWVRQAQRRLLDIALIAGLGLITLTCAARMPGMLYLYGLDAAFAEVHGSGFQTVVMSLSGLLVPPVIFLLLARTISDVIADYQRQSERDGLTGLLNRRAFDSVAETCLAQGGAVILCDIDNFKQVNDRFGHEAGDDVICTLAALLVHPHYPAGRIGGEEFVLLLPGEDSSSAVALAETIRRRFHDTIHPVLSANQRLSASFGIAYCAAGESPRAALRRADVALYEAKEAGRNRVSAFTPQREIAAIRAALHAA